MPRQQSHARWLDAFLGLPLGCGLLAAVSAIVGAEHWMLDNLSSGTLHLFVALTVLGVIAAIRRRARSAVLAAVASALLAVRIYPALDTTEHSLQPPVASWLVANVHTANTQHAALLALIRDRDPDVIGLVETDSRWLRALDAPLRAYSHRVLHPREDNFGVALYSRLPLIRSDMPNLGEGPTITATIALGKREVDLALVHVLPPISPEYTRSRNAQLARTGALRPRPGHGLVIAGDLNATPYSPTFRASFGSSPLRRIGSLTGTFPAVAPWLLRIPIDHVLAAGPIAVRRSVERDIASDHLPIVIELSSAE